MQRESGLDALNRGRTIVFNTLKRSGTAIPARRIVQIPVSPVSQYLGGLSELVSDLKRWQKDGFAALLYAGNQKEYLSELLPSEGITCTAEDHLAREPEDGTVLVIGESVGEGLVWPAEKRVILSERELSGSAERPKVRARRKKSTLVFSELSPGDYVVHETHGIGRFDVRPTVGRGLYPHQHSVSPQPPDGSTGENCKIEKLKN